MKLGNMKIGMLNLSKNLASFIELDVPGARYLNCRQSRLISSARSSRAIEDELRSEL